MRRFFGGFLMGNCAPLDLVLKPFLLFAFRFYVAYVFIKSGLTKVNDSFQVTPGTIDLFKYEYAVPVLPPEFAAYLASYAELILPIFLILGIFTRPAALGLFILNAVAATSYPDINLVGELYHVIWGVMLAVIFAFGPGKFSIDKWLSDKLLGKESNFVFALVSVGVLSAIGYFLASKFL